MEFVRRALRIREEEIDRKKDAIDKTLKALRQDEEYLDLERQYRSAQFNLAKLSAQHKDVTVAKQALSVAQSAYFDKLAKLGKRLEDITYTPSCPICLDKGYTIGGACSCLLETVKSCMTKEGDLPHTLSCYDACDVSRYEGEDKSKVEKLIGFLDKWTKAYPTVSKNYIVIDGKPGVGKTHLAGIVANQFLDSGKSVSFYNALNLNKIFLRAHLAPLREKAEILQDVNDPDLLVIDDLGVEQILNNVTIEALYALLNERQNRATIITTNLSPDLIHEKYDDRVYSRLSGYNSFIFTLTGRDLRRKN